MQYKGSDNTKVANTITYFTSHLYFSALECLADDFDLQRIGEINRLSRLIANVDNIFIKLYIQAKCDYIWKYQEMSH